MTRDPEVALGFAPTCADFEALTHRIYYCICFDVQVVVESRDLQESGVRILRGARIITPIICQQWAVGAASIDGR